MLVGSLVTSHCWLLFSACFVAYPSVSEPRLGLLLYVEKEENISSLQDQHLGVHDELWAFGAALFLVPQKDLSLFWGYTYPSLICISIASASFIAVACAFLNIDQSSAFQGAMSYILPACHSDLNFQIAYTSVKIDYPVLVLIFLLRSY